MEDFDYDIQNENPVEIKKFVVGFYLVDQAYGGHEEGGWWYEYGELIRLARKTFTADEEEKAYEYCDRANVILKRWQDRTGVPSINSMASQGRVFAEIYCNEAPNHYPPFTPHYE